EHADLGLRSDDDLHEYSLTGNLSWRDKAGRALVPCPPRVFRTSLVADGLLQGAACGDLHTVTGGNLDLRTGLRVAAGARGALDTLDGQQAGDLHSLTLADGLDEHVLQGRQSSVGLGLGERSALGNGGDELG